MKPAALVALVLVVVLLARRAAAEEGDVSTNASESYYDRAASDVQGWIDDAVGLLVVAGSDPNRINADDIALVIHFESSGNPTAVNTTDKNWENGDPSVGLMQITGTNFERFRLVSLPDDQTDPVANICASVRYAIAVYGSTSNIPGVKSVRAGAGYRPY